MKRINIVSSHKTLPWCYGLREFYDRIIVEIACFSHNFEKKINNKDLKKKQKNIEIMTNLQ